MDRAQFDVDVAGHVGGELIIDDHTAVEAAKNCGRVYPLPAVSNRRMLARIYSARHHEMGRTAGSNAGRNTAVGAFSAARARRRCLRNHREIIATSNPSAPASMGKIPGKTRFPGLTAGKRRSTVWYRVRRSR